MHTHTLYLARLCILQDLFHKRITPAVTRVDEWTSALMGVGAAIAAISHPLIGMWGLLVREHIITNVAIRPVAED